ncbi:MAG: glycoside hydrolase family 9 protein [Ignavibacteriales bacterium]|nr:glycoside hydrolase family 9 protein [Ignavibacteriales bacterium]
MQKTLLIILFCFSTLSSLYPQKSWIRINQLGYTPKAIKVAVLVTKEDYTPVSFQVCNANTNQIVYSSGNIKSFGKFASFEKGHRLDFSDITEEGSYYIKVERLKSPVFRIANDVYKGTADFLLKYMRQQRSGYNPFLKDSCHTHDGFIIYHPTLDSTYIDVKGGWHDASDYLQYVTTSATATYQMLFAYQQNPSAFGDLYDKDGNESANGIPDILDEAKWGLDWLVKMNPKNEMMFNQLADDRDHALYDLPTVDKVDYGKGPGLGRPVYFCTGEPQGVFKYKNKATGIASTAGKYASAFALGSDILKIFYPEFAKMIQRKSVEAYEFGKKNPGVCQTAPCKGSYYYEEDNWVDDMELAAAQLYKITGNKKYLTDAISFGKKEPVTPWMGADTASHYQWYPFLNFGHYLIAAEKKEAANEFIANLKKGIDKVFKRGKNNPFQIGIPFIWCSNNLVSAIITQSNLYFKLTKDKTYQQMEAALRDWLFGCNPWGTSMIVGLPKVGDSPVDPHSGFTLNNKYEIPGGLVDGPVYATIYNKLLGLTLHREDVYKEFQSSYIVYHDDYGDYSTNEPTMDGTAGLIYYLSSMEAEGNK